MGEAVGVEPDSIYVDRGGPVGLRILKSCWVLGCPQVNYVGSFVVHSVHLSKGWDGMSKLS